MKVIVGIVFNCYEVFGEFIDPEQYYSKEAFTKRGKTIEDAYAEVYANFCGPTDGPPMSIRFTQCRRSTNGK